MIELVVVVIYWTECMPRKFGNWASEASPTLGCSIEISRDIYIYSILHILTIVFHGTRTVEYQPIFHGVT